VSRPAKPLPPGRADGASCAPRTARRIASSSEQPLSRNNHKSSNALLRVGSDNPSRSRSVGVLFTSVPS
jgi:hypothetical protein